MKSPHPNAALLFIDWSLSEEGQKVLAVDLGKGVAMKGIPSKYKEFKASLIMWSGLSQQPVETTYDGLSKNLWDEESAIVPLPSGTQSADHYDSRDPSAARSLRRTG